MGTEEKSRSPWSYEGELQKQLKEMVGKRQKDLREMISTFNLILRIFIPAISILAVILIVSYWSVKDSFQEAGVFKSKVIKNVNYQSQSWPMTKVEAIVKNGVVEVSLEAVREKRLISFEYNGVDGSIPLLAYVTPSGKIVTAVGLSEPCNSKSFHLEGNEIVCNLCFTRWDLETLKGNSGECAGHSIYILTHVNNKERLMLKEADIQNWKLCVV